MFIQPRIVSSVSRNIYVSLACHPEIAL